MNTILGKAFAVLLGLSLTTLVGCAVDEPAKQVKQAAPAAADSPTSSPSSTPTYTPPPSPEPDGTYRSSCDYLLGDHTSYSQSGYRFVGDASMHNTGNIGTVNEVKAIWFLAGGGKIEETRKVRVPAGKRKRVGITKPIGGDEIDLHQSLGYNTKTCKVTVSILDTYGEVQ